MREIDKRLLRLERTRGRHEPPRVFSLPPEPGIERERAKARILATKGDPRGFILFVRDDETWEP
jgi:hypothetical protein